MFRTLIYPSSGACDCAVELPHRSFCSRFVVCWRFGAAVFEWCPCCWLKPATTPTQPHRNSNTHRTKNNTTNMAIQQNSRKLLMMDILMCETCWAHKKWNKTASDNKLVFYSSGKNLSEFVVVFSLPPANARIAPHFQSQWALPRCFQFILPYHPFIRRHTLWAAESIVK